MPDNENTDTDTTPQEGESTATGDQPDPATATSTSATGGDAAAEPAKPQKLADVFALLDDDARALVQAELNKRNNEARNLRQRLSDAEPKARAHDDAQAAQQSAEDRAAEQARTANERASQMARRMVAAEVRALAADRFADADDAAAFIDAEHYLGSDGEPDTAGIGSALDDLLSRKPHLAKADPKPRAPAPNPAQGSSSTGPAKVTGPDRGKELFDARRGNRAAASS